MVLLRVLNFSLDPLYFISIYIYLYALIFKEFFLEKKSFL